MESDSFFQIPSPLESFEWPSEVRDDFNARNLKLIVKRDDLIHPLISGNKWRKLKLNIEQAKSLGKKGVLTFGGAYSNHLIAVASACSAYGLQSKGIVRGDELNENSNDNLQKCAALGMQLSFVSREEYRMKDDWDYLSEIKSEFSQFYLVPEGGKNFYGIIGCQEIIREIHILNKDINEFWLGLGTGTTAAGIALSIHEDQVLHVVPALKNFDVKMEIEKLILGQFNDQELATEIANKMIAHEHEVFGRYGHSSEEIAQFIKSVEVELDLPLEEVYTAKTFFALLDYYKSNEKLVNKQILFLHTGGLFNKKGHQ
ncbi:MAG: pyridoxal-phosphate dependent enzyme [Bacteroidetes bacterium]|nr:pyridoxal-phosphate dependent enzyme [Bacteroidota bacterium]